MAHDGTGLLEGKAAIVTGAGTGIGEAIAHRFAAEGARVLVAGKPAGPVEDVAEAIRATGAQAEAFVGDLSDESSASRCVEAAVERLGALDVLVNNASISGSSIPLQDYPTEMFDDVIRCNLRSAFLMTRFALPPLHKRRGTILFSGSSAGISGAPTFAAYSATKAFFHTFALALAAEQASHGVRVNAVAIGLTDTAWNRADAGGSDGAAMLEALPMRRMASVEEMAQVFAWLASDRASYVTGSAWQADGGFVVGHGRAGAETPPDLTRPPADTLPLRYTFDGLRDRWWEEARRETAHERSVRP